MCVAKFVAETFHHGNMRVYMSTDVVGVSVGGALKNVIAIASGISDGMGFGNNARAALITRGLAEISRFGMALGASGETFSGLAGAGDLVLTCNAMQSRNFSLGVGLGKNENLLDIINARTSVAEGVSNASSVSELARSLKIDMPICFAVDEVLNNSADIDSTIQGLLSRPVTMENDEG